MKIKDLITIAANNSGSLVEDIQAAHSQAHRENPALGILLLDLIRDAAKINQKLHEIEGVL